MLKKVPAWAKIVIALFFLFIVGSALGQLAEYILPPLLILILILFPGPDRSRPRLVRLTPLLWALGFFASVAFLVAAYFGKTLIDSAAREPSTAELWTTLIFSVPLIVSLLQRNRFLRPLLIISTIVFTAIAFNDFHNSVGDFQDKLDLGSNLISEWVLAIYLWLKAPPVSRQPGNLTDQ